MTSISVICITFSIINFIISLYYFRLYKLEKEFSNSWYESSLQESSLNTDLLWCLHLYKKAYDKSYNKMDKEDFDITYPKQYLHNHSKVVSELHRLEK